MAHGMIAVQHGELLCYWAELLTAITIVASISQRRLITFDLKVPLKLRRSSISCGTNLGFSKSHHKSRHWG